jgi:hypothetical protein
MASDTGSNPGTPQHDGRGVSHDRVLDADAAGDAWSAADSHFFKALSAQ